MHLVCVWGWTWRPRPVCFRPWWAAPYPRKSEVTFQGPAPLLGLPTPGDKKSAWSKVTAAPTTCSSPGARGWEPGEPVPKVQEPGGEREGRGPGRGCCSPAPGQPLLAAVLGSQDEFYRAAFPLHWTPCKGLRTSGLQLPSWVNLLSPEVWLYRVISDVISTGLSS